MESLTKIAELASIINDRTTEIDEYLKNNRHASPSFSLDAAPSLPIPESLHAAKYKILEACTELQALIEGPREYLMRITSPRESINVLISLQAIYRKKLATCFAPGEEITYAELARRCDMDEDQLRRLIRTAVANHIFYEPREGVVAHSAASRLIAEEELVCQWIGLVCDEMWPTGCQTVPAILKWPGSQELSETAFVLANGEAFWDALRNNPVRAQRFADGMRFLQTLPIFDLSHLFDALGWDSDGCPRVMVDIGGSRGSVSKALLQRHARLQCYVQDFPEMIRGITVPDSLQGRLHFVAHNFFTEQPIKHADVYFLRSILHNWSDKYAIQIIRNLMPALKAGAKVVLNEVCLPEPNTQPFYHAQVLRGYDLSMCQNFNSKERDRGEWESLFTTADPRFKLNRIVSPQGSRLSVIEFVWQGE